MVFGTCVSNGYPLYEKKSKYIDARTKLVAPRQMCHFRFKETTCLWHKLGEQSEMTENPIPKMTIPVTGGTNTCCAFAH